MSKSAESDASRINLLDSPDVLTSKIKRAKTDGEQPFSLTPSATWNLGLLCSSPEWLVLVRKVTWNISL